MMGRFTKFLFFSLGLIAMLGLLAPRATNADELYSRIRGTVVDATGASVPDVVVTATNTATGATKSFTTGPDGSFDMLDLATGPYKVTAAKANFKTFTATGIQLSVNQPYVLTIKMELGAVTQQVMVEASAMQVETTSMQLGYTLDSKTITDMPLNGRNWIQLQQLQPGVVAQSDRFSSNFATNGSQSQQNSYLINGTDSNDLPLNSPLVIPSPDAISEFQLITNTINPEYGRNSGGILNAVIKSGTNHFHGDGFDFYRDTSMNARTFFQKTPTVFHQNQFGGTIGGPVWKDHLFGFFSYQGTRARQPSPNATGQTTVFTAAQRAGNFGSFPQNSNKTPPTSRTRTSFIPLFGDASSPCPVSGGVRCPTGIAYHSFTDSVGGLHPGLFDTGVIPTQDLNPLSVNLMNTFVPLPNLGANGFTFQPTRTNSIDQYLYRVDHTFNQHDSLWFYSFIQTNPVSDPVPFTGATVPGFPQVSKSHIKQYTAAWTHTFNGSTLNELRFGYTRLNFDAVEPTSPVLPSSLGWQINPQGVAGAGLPRINITGLFTLGFSSNGPQPRIDQTYQATDNFSKVYGKHTFKMGFEGRRFTVGNPFFASNNGQFGFTTTNPVGTGNAGADFLLGFPNTYAQNSGGFIDGRAYQMYSYIQDQYKLKSNLTLTYGIGYQIDTPLSDFFNGGVGLQCLVANQQSKVFPTAPIGLNYPGDPGCTNSGGYGTQYGQFGPRVGFAYSPNWGGKIFGGPGKTSIRGGYGIYYNRSEEELLLQNLAAPPFGLGSTGIGDLGGKPSFIAPFTDVACISSANAPIPGCVPSGVARGVNPVQPASISNKFPFTPPQPGNKNVDFTQFAPMSNNIIDSHFRSPYAENYNLTIQRELPGQMILSLAYVGAVAHHLVSEVEANHIINPALCLADPNCAGDPSDAAVLPTQNGFDNNLNPTGVPANFPYGGSSFSTAIGAPIIASYGQQSSFGNSNYNAFQAFITKSLSHGLTFQASYTYSHSLDNGSSFENSGFGGVAGPGLNPFNYHDNYGDSAFDARHRFVLSYTYNIPSLQRIAHWIPSRVADGWRFGGITTFQGGFPIYPVELDGTSMTCSDNWQFYQCPDRPNQVGPVKLVDPRSNLAANGLHQVWAPGSFTTQTLGQLGNVHRGAIHAFGVNNWDFQFSKDTKITESTMFEMRAELFNMWNHTQFDGTSGGSVGNNILSSTFGTVQAAKPARIMQLAAKFIF